MTVAVDGVFSVDLVVHPVGESGRRAVAQRLGPAGAIRVELSSGLLVAVDAADVGQLVFVDLDVERADSSILDELVGSEQASEILDESQRALTRPVRVPRSLSSNQRAQLTSRPVPGDRAQFFGEVLRQVAIFTVQDLRPLPKFIAALEVVVRSGELEEIPRLESMLRDRSVQTVRSLLVDAESIAVEIALLDPEIREKIVELVDRASQEMPELHAVDLFESPLELSVDVRKEVDERPVRQKVGEIRQVESGWLDIELDRSKRHHWVRVMNSATQELVALAPVLESRGRFFAEVFVPDDQRSESLHVDVKLDPLPLPSNPLELHLRAIRLGYRAVQADRCGAPDDAAELWKLCAECWAELGDAQRADGALKYAARGLPRRQFRSLVDRVLSLDDL
jgi:hypothetical protein